MNALSLCIISDVCFLYTCICSLFTSRLYWITKRAGERSGSGLMKANAWHHRADAVSSIVALIGVGNDLHPCICLENL